ncbi:hypothetical protein RIF29_04489 [Crotalaria pallida]|uniref:Uncharacterized protein n=1 Tax=Crotalaria pallida TaxID=3830 RepID=A0AAN9J207_CROPI
MEVVGLGTWQGAYCTLRSNRAEDFNQYPREGGKGGELSLHETTIIAGALDLTQKIGKGGELSLHLYQMDCACVDSLTVEFLLGSMILFSVHENAYLSDFHHRFSLPANSIHYSKQGQLFKSQVQIMHKEILQSPWLCELMAYNINLREIEVKPGKEPSLFDGCSLTFKDGKPSLVNSLIPSKLILT